MFTSGYTVLLLLGGFVALYNLIFSRKEKYAPGPTQRFLVGNTFQVPTIKTWIYFDKLFRKHGPMVRLSLAGDEFLVLSDPADAEELLVRRSKNYSSRPPLVYAGKYLSNNKRVALLPYGDQLRKLRTAFHQMLQPRVIGGYESIQELESLVLLSDLLTKPQGFMRHCQRFAASLVFKLSYGRRLSDDDGDLNVLNEIMESFVQDVNPGSHLVDTFTFLDYLPDFLATWRADARRKHERDLKLYSRLVLEVKEKMEKQDVELECFAARLWDQQAKMNLDLEDISYAVRLLWAFDFLPEVDETGKPIPADPEDCTSGGTSHPRSIPVRIVPRSEAHAATTTAEIEREGL